MQYNSKGFQDSLLLFIICSTVSLQHKGGKKCVRSFHQQSAQTQSGYSALFSDIPSKFLLKKVFLEQGTGLVQTRLNVVYPQVKILQKQRLRIDQTDICLLLNLNKFTLIQPQRSAGIHVIWITSDLPSNVTRSGNYHLVPACNIVQIVTNQ